MMKTKQLYIVILVLLSMVDCSKSNCGVRSEIGQVEKSFFGDSCLVVFASNKPNGYDVSVVKGGGLCLWHFQRGDSINVYINTYDSCPEDIDTLGSGTYTREIEMPTTNDFLWDGIGRTLLFFRDVNFDGEEELVVGPYGSYRGDSFYNFYDLAHSVGGVRFIESLDDEIYQYMAEGPYWKTEFDYENKTIHISEGYNGDYTELWGKVVKDKYGNESLKAVRKECTEFLLDIDGSVVTDTYKLIDDNLKLVSSDTVKYGMKYYTFDGEEYVPIEE